LIKSKANHKILVNTSSGNQARSQNCNRGQTTTEFQHLNIFNGPCFYSIIHSSSVFRFKPTNEKSAFIEMRSFKSFDSEVPIFYFGSMLPFAHKLNLACKSASKPLNAISARSVVCFLQPILQLSKKSSGPPLRLRFTRFGCTPTPHVQSKQRLCSKLRH